VREREGILVRGAVSFLLFRGGGCGCCFLWRHFIGVSFSIVVLVLLDRCVLVSCCIGVAFCVCMLLSGSVNVNNLFFTMTIYFIYAKR